MDIDAVDGVGGHDKLRCAGRAAAQDVPGWCREVSICHPFQSQIDNTENYEPTGKLVRTQKDLEPPTAISPSANRKLNVQVLRMVSDTATLTAVTQTYHNTKAKWQNLLGFT